MISSLQFTHKMLWQTLLEVRGVPRGEAQDVPVLPPPPRPCASPPPQPERLVMRKDVAVCNKKKILGTPLLGVIC
jgi:hypothetical protein